MPTRKPLNKSIFDHFRIMLMGFAALAALAIVLVLFAHRLQKYRQSVGVLREKKITYTKQFVHNVVDIESNYILHVKRGFDERKSSEIENHVQEAHNLAETLYEENKNSRTTNELKRLIIKTIASLNSAETPQRVLINSTDGMCVYNPTKPELEGTSLLQMKDETGTYCIREELKIIANRGEGFRYVSDSTAHENRIVFVKEFPPLNWYFISMTFPFDYYRELCAEIANKVTEKNFAYLGDAFIYECDGDVITSRGEHFLDEKPWNIANSTDPTFAETYATIQQAVGKYPMGSFTSYSAYPQGSSYGDAKALAEKISYVKFLPSLQWIVGAGFFPSAIDAEIKEQVAHLRSNFYVEIGQIVLLFILLALFEMILLYCLEKKFKNDVHSFVTFFKKSEKSLEHLDLRPIQSKEFIDLGAVANQMISDRKEVEESLIEEQKKALKSTQLKSAFLASMSHEIRTPMNAIVGLSNFLLDDLSPEEQQDFMFLIKKNSQQLLQLIDSIIYFSQIETGQVAPHLKPVCYDDLCETLNKKYQHKIRQEKLDITFSIINTLPIYFISMTDENLLLQVLERLLDNALKFTPAGKVMLNIELQNDRIYFKVIDTGIGISEKYHHQIFNQFTQVDDKLSKLYSGTGIGLTISAKLVELIGGKIGVESSLGKGAMFQFYIPVEQ